MVPANPIPFQNGKFGIMTVSLLILPKSLAQLIHGTVTGTEQPFHVVFRRCNQIAFGILKTGFDDERFKVKIDGGKSGDCRGFDFQNPAFLKKMAGFLNQPGSFDKIGS